MKKSYILLSLLLLVVVFCTTTKAYWIDSFEPAETNDSEQISIGDWGTDLTDKYDYGIANKAAVYINIITLDMVSQFDNVDGKTNFIILEDLSLGQVDKPLDTFYGSLFGNNCSITFEMVNTRKQMALFLENHGTMEKFNIVNSKITSKNKNIELDDIALLTCINSGTIKNIKVSNSSLSVDSYFTVKSVGGLVAKSIDGLIEKVFVNTNILIEIEDQMPDGSNYRYFAFGIGGIVGVTFNSKITNAHYFGNIDMLLTTQYVQLNVRAGGIVGDDISKNATSLTIDNSSSHGKIETTVKRNQFKNGASLSYLYIGGIIGHSDSDLTINNCLSELDIISDLSKSTGRYFYIYFGGLLGFNPANINIYNSLVNAKIHSLVLPVTKSYEIVTRYGGLLAGSWGYNAVGCFVNVEQLHMELYPSEKDELNMGNIVGEQSFKLEDYKDTFATKTNVIGLPDYDIERDTQVELKDPSFIFWNSLNWDTKYWHFPGNDYPTVLPPL